jgi:hypothetical protein
MSQGFLKLEIAGFTCTIDRFVNGEYPRIGSDGNAAVTYTASGVPVGSGNRNEAPYLFDVSGLLWTEEKEQLQLIWAEHDRLRRANQPCNILVTDTTQLHEERLPRTRAIAPSTTQRNFPATKRPVYTQRWTDWTVIFTLNETDRVAA